MRSSLPGALLAASLLALAPLAAAPGYYLTGSPADARPAQTRGGLMLSGGGGEVEAAFRWFIACAGGGDIVVLRSTEDDHYHDYLYRQLGGVDSVETFVLHSRADASDARLLDAVARAEGIFLAGGDQSTYVRRWQDTPLAAALAVHVRSGRPLGGTSAGLAVLGEHCFAALEPGSLTSPVALADPFDPQVTLVTGFLRFDLLRGIMTDSHFSPRDRLGRSLVFLARLWDAHPGSAIAGLGIDERTVLCLEPDGTGRVFSTEPGGAVWLMEPSRPAEVLAPGQPLTLRAVTVTGLGPDSELHLPSRRVVRPVTVRSVSVVAGVLSSTP